MAVRISLSDVRAVEKQFTMYYRLTEKSTADENTSQSTGSSSGTAAEIWAESISRKEQVASCVKVHANISFVMSR